MATIVSIKFVQNTHKTNPSPRRRPAPLLRTRRRRPEKKTVLPRVVDLVAAPAHAVVLEPLLVRELAERGFAFRVALTSRCVARRVGYRVRGRRCPAARRRRPAERVVRPARIRRQRRRSAGHDCAGCQPCDDGAPRRRVERAGAAGEQNCCQHGAAMPCATGANSLPPPSARRAAAGLHHSSEHNSA